MVSLWEAAVLVFVAAAGAAMGTTAFFDSRMRELRVRVNKLELEIVEANNQQKFLLNIMRTNGLVVPPAGTEINIGAGGEMNVGGDVAGRDKITQTVKPK